MEISYSTFPHSLELEKGAIQCLRRQEEVGRWSKKCSFLSIFRARLSTLR